MKYLVTKHYKKFDASYIVFTNALCNTSVDVSVVPQALCGNVITHILMYVKGSFEQGLSYKDEDHTTATG